MKKILITGENSYVGNSFKIWVEKCKSDYIIETVSLRRSAWRCVDFSKYDIVFHVAGIAHVDTKAKMEELYYQVNRDLTIDVAKKARDSGVSQFIFMSSIIVYGESKSNNHSLVITRETKPNPSGFYGRSKLEAEEKLLKLSKDNFKVVIIRAPMIYGRNSKGNYPKLAKLAKITPIFPKIDNSRSMLYIDNLCEFIRLVIENQEKGIFYPQNREYVNTTQLVSYIAKISGKRVKEVKFLDPIVKLFMKKINTLNKIFGTMVYDQSLSDYNDFQYCIYDFEESINITEGE